MTDASGAPVDMTLPAKAQQHGLVSGTRLDNSTFAIMYTQLQVFVASMHLSEIAKAVAAYHRPSCAIIGFLLLKTDQICFHTPLVSRSQLCSERVTSRHRLVRVLFVAE